MTGENKSPSALVYSSQSPHATPAASGSNCHLFPVLLPCAQACAGVGVGARTAFFRADAFFGKDTGCQDGGLPAASLSRPSRHVMVNAGCPYNKKRAAISS